MLRLDTGGGNGDDWHHERVDEVHHLMARALGLTGRANIYAIRYHLELLAELLDEQLKHGPPKDVNRWARATAGSMLGTDDDVGATGLLSELGGFGWDREQLPDGLQVRHVTTEVRTLLERKVTEAVLAMIQRWVTAHYFDDYARKPIRRQMRPRPGRNPDRAPAFTPPGRT